MYNEILFRRRNKMLLNTGSGADRNTIQYIATVLKNMESYGYTVSEEVLNVIKTYSANEIFTFYSEFENIIMTMTGANYSYEPMYPNFPSEVMEMNDATLYINAIVHYLTYGKLRPVSHKNNRLPLFDEMNIKVIDLADSSDIENIMCNIMSSKSSLSQQDKNDLLWYFESYKENAIIPEEIPSKENSAYVCMLYINNASLVNYDIVRKYIRTATDVLRLATAIVCSRNLRLRAKDNSSYWKVSDKYNIENALKNMIGDKDWIALQGECIAPNVQGNKYKVIDADMYIFNLLYPSGRVDSIMAKNICMQHGMKFVPIISTDYVLPDTVNDVLDYAHGKSQLSNTLREGIVFRSKDGKQSFKAVDPLFLLKYDE